ncbi:aminotransferase class IV [Flavobacterium luteum]|uniref:branched-chain-amino-acid transaminase n=1 Tax=Flavobacterium luteum TaxID=2026654 RepID=A0A7J5A872_9FLAO|nr:aminotransferase class IV [Flavobacterium luteum]KAB1153774.1 aminotransferase class IV [Flavobacterium luteum]
MINYNGTILPSSTYLLHDNRAFLYGDGVFETVKIINNTILFLEDHYFRLMSSMRILRMEIPMNFTMEYFEEQIKLVTNANNCSVATRARITIYRNPGGYYLPETNTISFLIHSVPLENKMYAMNSDAYEVDLYKDIYVSKQLLSTLKTTNKIINITASIYAKENGLQNCLLLNENKNVVEAIQGNIFMVLDNTLKTPPVSEGCLNGIMRKQIIALAKKIDEMEVLEEPISPFDLQKADELFITNVIKGIQPITKYRKKEYKTAFSQKVLNLLNDCIVT